MSRKGGKRRRHPPIGAPTMEVNLEELAGVLERAKGALSAEDHAKLTAAMATLASTTQIVAELIAQLQGKKTSLERLRRMLFGAPTEKTDDVLGEERAGADRQDGAVSASANGAAARKKAPGHGGEPAAFVEARGLPLSRRLWRWGRRRCSSGCTVECASRCPRRRSWTPDRTRLRELLWRMRQRSAVAPAKGHMSPAGLIRARGPGRRVRELSGLRESPVSPQQVGATRRIPNVDASL